MSADHVGASDAESGASESRHAARSSETRAKLIASARRLFAERGFVAVGIEEIVRGANLTRGALYHHFRDKEDLFLAVYEQVESDLTTQIAQMVDGAPDADGVLAPGIAESPWEALELGAARFLAACGEPEVQRIALLDAPAVLGWETWREVGSRYGLGLIEGVLAAAIETGELEEQPVGMLAHMLMGAIDELALLVARADDQASAYTEATASFGRVLAGLRR
jgi:AcrR family transcriptional regulator